MSGKRVPQLCLGLDFSAAASPARTSAEPARAKVSTEPVPASGVSTSESSRSSSPPPSSSKTSRRAPRSTCVRCGRTCMLRATEREPWGLPPAMWAHLTGASGSSSSEWLVPWPTATATDANASGSAGYSTASGRHSGTTLTDAAVRGWATPCARDEKGISIRVARKSGRCLPDEVLYPTPSASSYGTQQGGGSGSRRSEAAEPGDVGEVEWDAAQPGLGRVPHGLPRGLDGLAGLAGRPSWPAGRGQEQHTWEPPRAVQKQQARTARRQRLKALGNGVVPQDAYLVGLILRKWMRSMRAADVASVAA